MSVTDTVGNISLDSALAERNLSKLVDKLSPYMTKPLPRPQTGLVLKTPEESETGKKLRQVNASTSYIALTLGVLIDSIDL